MVSNVSFMSLGFGYLMCVCVCVFFLHPSECAAVAAAALFQLVSEVYIYGHVYQQHYDLTLSNQPAGKVSVRAKNPGTRRVGPAGQRVDDEQTLTYFLSKCLSG